MDDTVRNIIVPDLIFIVPYRNRHQQKAFFSVYMNHILGSDTEYSNNPTYEIYFSHQADTRPFNRGAVKNIGFLAIKSKYPNDYRNMTLVFNDVDTIPFANIFNYSTTLNRVKHFYGFTHTLGGIFSIKGSDFERLNGFPNYWGWGLEDTVLQMRCNKNKVLIDRSEFKGIGHADMIQSYDGVNRTITATDFQSHASDNGKDGLLTISGCKFTIDKKSTIDLDNVHVKESPFMFVINIVNFVTPTSPKDVQFVERNLMTQKNVRVDVSKQTGNDYEERWAKSAHEGVAYNKVHRRKFAIGLGGIR